MKKLKIAWQIVNGLQYLFVDIEKIAPPPCYSDEKSKESSDSEIRSQSSSTSQS